MSERNAPSVIVLTPDNYATIRQTIRRLRGQAISDRLEIAIVAPTSESLGLDESERKDFGRVSIVEFGTMTSTAKARDSAGERTDRCLRRGSFLSRQRLGCRACCPCLLRDSLWMVRAR